MLLLLLSAPLNAEGTDKMGALLGKRPYLLTTSSAIEMLLQVIAFETVDANKLIESARIRLPMLKTPLCQYE